MHNLPFRHHFVALLLVLWPALCVQASQGVFPAGAHAVACSNVEQDFTRVEPGSQASDYWSGVPGTAGERYVTQLLLASAPRLGFSVQVPSREDNDLWDRQAGKRLSYFGLVCYPTPANNTRPDYPLPNGAVVPRMQRGAEPPLVKPNPAQAQGRWPLIVLSHGLGGSPLGAEYLAVIRRLAEEGYVVYAPFHGDARFSRTKVEDFSDVWFVLTRYGEIAEMQALRALSLKAGLDHLLGLAEYAQHIDQEAIVGFGASLGGMGMMLVQGAKITASWGGAERWVTRDRRYKAVVGYVPFSGYPFLAAFGDGNRGVSDIRTPYLAIAGNADTVAPLSRTAQMVERLAGTRQLVVIDGMPHGLREQDVPELFGWTFAFYRAMLSPNQADREAFARMTSIPGGSPDRVEFSRMLAWGPAEEAEAVEFVSDRGKYFFTARAHEIALLDSLPGIWRRTGNRFVVHQATASVGLPMCRFYAFDGAAINTHFHSISAADCALIAAQPWAREEGMVLRAWPASACLPDQTRVLRYFNPGLINHRYLTQEQATASRPGAGWDAEGPVFCAWKAPGLP